MEQEKMRKMRRIHRNSYETVLLVFCLLVSVTMAQSGGQYEITWSTINGGGGVSSGGPYTLMGTIAQHDAAYSYSDDYELLGGFWPGEPLCVIDFDHFARFADLWLLTGPDLPSDLYEDGTVDLYDLEKFVEDWLCYCPYDWPLR